MPTITVTPDIVTVRLSTAEEHVPVFVELGWRSPT
jgi:hypothetical protein